MTRTLTILFAALLCGCVVQRSQQTGEMSEARGDNSSPIAASPLPQSAAPVGPQQYAVILRIMPEAGYPNSTLYWGDTSNSFPQSRYIGSVTNLTVTNAAPTYYLVIAQNERGSNSAPSNLAAFLGTQTVVTGYDQRSDSPAGPFTDAGQVFTRTNPPTTFHCLRIESRNELVTYP